MKPSYFQRLSTLPWLPGSLWLGHYPPLLLLFLERLDQVPAWISSWGGGWLLPARNLWAIPTILPFFCLILSDVPMLLFFLLRILSPSFRYPVPADHPFKQSQTGWCFQIFANRSTAGSDPLEFTRFIFFGSTEPGVAFGCLQLLGAPGSGLNSQHFFVVFSMSVPISAVQIHVYISPNFAAGSTLPISKWYYNDTFQQMTPLWCYLSSSFYFLSSHFLMFGSAEYRNLHMFVMSCFCLCVIRKFFTSI